MKRHSGQGVIAATGLAKILSGDLGDLTLALGPASYSRRTNTLYLPGIPAGDIPRHVEVELLGFLSHEAWERRWGTWDPLDPRWSDRPGLKALVNGLGDAMIDLRGAQEYPGAGLHVRTVVKKDWAVFRRNYNRAREKPSIRNMAILSRYVAEGIATPAEIAKALPAYLPWIYAITPLWRTMDTTSVDGCVEAAQAIYDILCGEAVPDTGDRGVQALPEGADNFVMVPQLQETSNNDHNSDLETLTRIVDGMFPGQAVYDASSKFDSKELPQVYTFDPSQDQVYHPSIRNAVPLAPELYESQAQKLILRTRQALTTNLPLPRRRQTSGKLDNRELTRLVVGHADVLQRRVRMEAVSTAAAFSLDESWSMRGAKIRETLLLAHAFNSAFGRLRIPTGIYGWTTQQRVKLGNWNVYRQEALRTRIYKEFEDRWDDPKVLKRLAKISVEEGTPTGEALLFAAVKLSRRPERRKLLFFLTDGEPSLLAHGPTDIHEKFIRTVLERCDQAGIEVIGLGIKADLSGLFPRWAKVDDVAELFDTTTDELVKALRR